MHIAVLWLSRRDAVPSSAANAEIDPPPCSKSGSYSGVVAFVTLDYILDSSLIANRYTVKYYTDLLDWTLPYHDGYRELTHTVPPAAFAAPLPTPVVPSVSPFPISHVPSASRLPTEASQLPSQIPTRAVAAVSPAPDWKSSPPAAIFDPPTFVPGQPDVQSGHPMVCLECVLRNVLILSTQLEW